MRISIFSLIVSLTMSVCVHAGQKELIERMQSGGHILMIRHAYAPGTGDPANFTIGDCSTQRNLDDSGRLQAEAIGQWLRARGIKTVRIFSSQWCRCLETARLLGMGKVHELPALNSFFQRPQDREPNLAALRQFIHEQPAEGKLIIMVTHFVTISAVTGKGVSSGEGVLVRVDNPDEAIGRLSFGQ